MADQGKWFKLWCTALGDASLENLSPHEWYCWARLGAYIKLHGTDGMVAFEAPAVALTSLFRVPSIDVAIAIIRKFPHCALGFLRSETDATVSPNIGNIPAPDCAQSCAHEEGKSETIASVSPNISINIKFLNWLKYQGDFSTGRVKKSRSRKRLNETVQEERRRDVEERRRDVSPNPLMPSAVSTSPANGTPTPNGKPKPGQYDTPEEDTMGPEEFARIKQGLGQKVEAHD